MAEEQVVTADASPVPSDLKRKFEDLEPEAPQQQLFEQVQHLESNENSTAEPDDGGKADATVSPSDEGEKKRPRIEEELDGPGISAVDLICSSYCCFSGRRGKKIKCSSLEQIVMSLYCSPEEAMDPYFDERVHVY